MSNPFDINWTAAAKSTVAREDGLRRAAGEILDASTIPGRAVIRVLAVAHLRGLNVVELLYGLADEFPGAARQRIAQLAATIESGVGPLEAVEESTRVVGTTSAVGLRLAHASGNLASLYEHIVSLRESDYGSEPFRNPAGVLIRLLVWFFLATLLMVFLSLFVIPTFESMFREFELALPAPTLLWLELIHYMPTVFLAGLTLVIIYLLVRSPALIRSWRLRFQPLSAGPKLPGRSAELLSLMSVGVHCGLGVESTLREILESHRSPVMGRRLQRAYDQIQHGTDVWKALSATGLISSKDSRRLSDAATPSMRGWLMERFSSDLRTNSDTRAFGFVRVLSVLGTLVLGLIVAFTCISLFMPLCALVQGLS